MMAESSQAGSSSLTSRALWLMCAKTLAFAFSFALPLLLVRRLDQHNFGLYKQAFLIVSTAVALLPLGFAMSAFYFLPREPERARQVVFNILLFNALVGLVACLALFLRPTLLAGLFRDAEMAIYAPSLGLAIMLWIIASFLEYVAIAHQEPKLATLFIVAAQVTKTALLVAAGLIFADVQSLIYAAIVQGALQTIILLIYLNSRFPAFWRAFEWDVMRRQLAYALPLGLAAMLYIIQTDLHNYVVSYRFDAAAFAVYSVGCFQLPLVQILSESVGSVMIPRVSLLQGQGGHREIVLLTARAMRKLAAVFFPVYVLLMVVRREFITGLFTEQYLGSVSIFAINLTLLPFSVFVLDPVMRAYAEHRYFLVKVRPFLIAVLFVALWMGTARFGLVGAIAIMVGVTILERLIMAFKAARIVRMTRDDFALFKDIGKFGAASVGAGLLTALVRAPLVAAGAHPLFVLAVCGGSFVAAYAVAVYALNVLTGEEWQTIRAAFARVQRGNFWKRAIDPSGVKG
jgi:O-antigen/teichoic acid export membrane protein